MKNKIKIVAVLAGSGAFAIDNAINNGADAFVTGDLKYHDFFKSNKIIENDKKIAILEAASNANKTTRGARYKEQAGKAIEAAKRAIDPQ